uniref:Small ribosomal subunit protein uS17c n=1 Tax=Platysiphonia delicata TaxID=2006979 RepID=A0A1Z1M0P4_9FLOR|nr:ribosomal protein S17 [Platysiphonia delicata]ARW59636.1 ribosomal protein S17 [Platysiphonia delicata]
MYNKENFATVVSNKMDKTIIVAIKTQVSHKKYKKIITKTHKYFVHDELNQCKIGDKVQIKQTRPLSKNKCWSLVKLLIRK